jgi:thiol-disulfide isomerase/thioredoxin
MNPIRVLAALLLSASVFAQVDPVEEEAWSKAMAIKQKREWPAAIAALQEFRRQYPDRSRALQAQIEIGVCWIGEAQNNLVLRRPTPKALESYTTAEALFREVLDSPSGKELAPRAQYLMGQLSWYRDDMAAAFTAYDAGVRTYAADATYHAKCLERRAAVSRALLYIERYSNDKDIAIVRRSRDYTALCGRPAPAFSADRWALGQPLTREGLLGQPVLVSFMASWCEKCDKEKEFIKDLKKRYGPRGLRFVGVVHPWREKEGKNRHTEESFLTFAAQSGLDFPLLQDSGELTGNTARAFGSQALPDLVLIDAQGNVRWHDHPASLQASTIERLLTSKPAQPK